MNPWIKHVKEYANYHNISYACAITKAKESYKQKDNRTNIVNGPMNNSDKQAMTEFIRKMRNKTKRESRKLINSSPSKEERRDNKIFEQRYLTEKDQNKNQPDFIIPKLKKIKSPILL